MDEYIRVSGKTVEEALMEASIELGTTSDNIEYRVVERESKGFLGLGAKKAVIEARRKQSDSEDEDIISEVFSEKTEKPVKEDRKKTEKKADHRVDPSFSTNSPADSQTVKRDIHREETHKAESHAEEIHKENDGNRKETEAFSSDYGRVEAADQKPVQEKERAPRVPADPQVAQERAIEFLSGMFNAMGMEVQIATSFEEGTLNIELSGDEMGTLIGKRGQTLDSIQYLTSLVVNKGKASYVKVRVDTENYRERREATLENLARNIAFKVKKTRRPVYLEPMNPYERRIIHSALQNDPYVTTHSEGEEPNRKVVVTLKKRERVETEDE